MNKLNLIIITSSLLLTWFSLGMVRAARMNKPIYEKDSLLDKLICLPIFLFATIFDKECQENFMEYMDPRRKADIIDFQAYKNKIKIR